MVALCQVIPDIRATAGDLRQAGRAPSSDRMWRNVRAPVIPRANGCATLRSIKRQARDLRQPPTDRRSKCPTGPKVCVLAVQECGAVDDPPSVPLYRP